MDPMNPDIPEKPVARRPRRLPGGGEELTDEQLEQVVGGVTTNWGYFGSATSLSAPSPIPMPYPDFLKKP